MNIVQIHRCVFAFTKDTIGVVRTIERIDKDGGSCPAEGSCAVDAYKGATIVGISNVLKGRGSANDAIEEGTYCTTVERTTKIGCDDISEIAGDCAGNVATTDCYRAAAAGIVESDYAGNIAY